MLPLFTPDRGPHIATGPGEPLGGQPQRLTRDTQPGRARLIIEAG